MGKEKIELFKDPQIKYNLELNADLDFRISSDISWESQISGKYFKMIPISYLKYKFFYAPTSVLDLYFLVDNSYLVPVSQNVYIPLGRVNQIILVRPNDLASGYIYFQYWLSNLESVKILDFYEKTNFSIAGGMNEIMRMPFPTHQMKVLFKCGTNPTSFKFYISIYTFNRDLAFTLDYKAGITDLFINNIYKFDKIGGSGGVTDPQYPWTSFETTVQIDNEDPGVSMNNCYLKLMSWKD